MKITDIDQYSTAEKIILAEQLWDSISKKDMPVSKEIKSELDHRLQNLEEGKTTLHTWEQVKARIDAVR